MKTFCCVVLVLTAGCLRETRPTRPSNGAVRLTDAQLVGVIESFDAAELKAATAAQPRLTDDDARAFAASMLELHTRALVELRQLETRLGLAVAPSSVSQAIDHFAEVGEAQYGHDASGYLDAQAQLHREALVLLECVVLPQARHPLLREHVEHTLRPVEQNHFERVLGLAPTAARVGRIDCDALCDEQGELGASLRAEVCAASPTTIEK